MSASRVRRAKAALSQWVKVPPGNRSSREATGANYGGNEMVEASGEACHELVTARGCRP